jgi:hypothetical protein
MKHRENRPNSEICEPVKEFCRWRSRVWCRLAERRGDVLRNFLARRLALNPGPDDAVANRPSEAPERIAFDAKPRHMPGPDGRYAFAMPGNYRAY